MSAIFHDLDIHEVAVLLKPCEASELALVDPDVPPSQIATAIILDFLKRDIAPVADPALVDQLVRWGGMTPDDAVKALVKGGSNAV